MKNATTPTIHATAHARLAAAARRAAPLVEPVEQRVLMSAGQLDPTYGTGGVVDQAHFGAADSIIVESGGRVIVNGFSTGALSRYTASGAIDPSFESSQAADAFALTPGGNIVVARDTVVEYTADGEPVTSFGANGSASDGAGHAVTSPVALVVQPDGKIDALFGTNGLGQTIEQFTAAGVLDTTFGTNGVVTAPAAYWFNSLGVAPGGKLIVGTYSNFNDNPRTFERLTATGALDPAFGTNGSVVASGGAPSVAPDGSLFYASNFSYTTPDGKSAIGSDVFKLTPAGTPDTSFGPNGNGMVQFTLPKPAASYDAETTVSSITVQPDGNVLLAGLNGDYDSGIGNGPTIVEYVARLRPDGSTDTTFGDGVHGSTDVTGYVQLGVGPAVAVDPAGSIYVSEGPAKLLGGGGTTGIYLVNGVLTVNGTANADAITVTQSGATTTATLNGASQSFTGVTSIFLNGSDGADTITVDPSVTLGASITGGAGNDTIHGGSGKDTIDGGAGADQLYGGGGNDTVTYARSNAAVNVSLDDQANDGAAGEGDNVHSDVETVIGGNGNDTLTGDAAGNRLDGGPGNDSLYGMPGNDTLVGGTGADLLSGGDGNDTADYSGTGPAVSLSLDNVANDGVAGEGDNILTDVENLTGSSGNAVGDTLIGDAADNILIGSPANDTIEPGLGNDTLIGNGGVDTADYSDHTGNLVATLNGGTGGTGGVVTSTTGERDVLSTDFENVVGGSGNDVLNGDGNNNVLNGGAGNDTLNGNAGNDTLIGGLGADVFNGGAGNDTADYSARTENLSLSNDGLANDGAPGEGDNIGADVETLAGGSGNDLITLNTGVDWAYGNAGNDTIYGSGNAGSYYYGGAGNDLIDVQDAAHSFVDAGDGTDTVIADGPTTAANDTVINAESVTTTQLGAKLTGTVIGATAAAGTSAANAFDGNVATYYDGVAANGSYVGLDLGAGNAATVTAIAFASRNGNANRMVGGQFQGSNSADFSGAVTLYTVGNQPYNAQLITVPVPAAGTFRYLRYVGPNGGYGDVAEVQFLGNIGPVTPPPSGGTAVLINGVITVTGTANADTINVATGFSTGGSSWIVTTTINGVTQTFADAPVVVNAGDGNDTISYVENRGTGANKTITLNGEGGDDTITSAPGAGGAPVVLNGGDGNDALSTGSSGQYTIATVTGGAGNDTITTGEDILLTVDGGAGDDLVVVAATATEATLSGGAGTDTLDFSSTNEALSVYLDGSKPSGTNSQIASGYGIKLDGSFEIAYSGSGADLIVAAPGGGDALYGNVGNDTLTAQGGADALFGGAGNDTLNARDGGATYIDGGDGTDTATIDAMGDTTIRVENVITPGPAGAAVLSNGVLTVNGTANADTISVDEQDPVDYTVTVNGVTQAFAMTAATPISSIVVNAGDGNDTVNVTATFMYGPGDPTVSVSGGAGDDKLSAYGDLPTTLDGGDGNDSISGGSYDTLPVTMLGGAGNDHFEFQDDVQPSINGGDGDDTVLIDGFGPSRPATLIGGAGTDTIDLASAVGGITINLDGKADSTIGPTGGYGTSLLGADIESVTVEGATGGAVINGDALDNVITVNAGPYPVIVHGGDGNDTIAVNGGQDNAIYGDAGNDILTAAGDATFIDGGDGFDTATTGGTTVNVEVVNGVPTPTPTTTQLTGATYGTAGTGTNTAGKATDGNLGTFFDSPAGSGGYVAIDLGSNKSVATIKFAPRSGWAGRMTGGMFQGSNTADFSSGVVTVYTIASAPTQGVLTTVSTNTATAYRYWRYIGANFTYSDIAEFQLFGSGSTTPTPTPTPTSTQLTGTTYGTAGAGNNVVGNATDGSVATFFDSPTGSGGYVAIDLKIAQAVAQIKFAPRSGWAGRMVGGRFQASNTADFSSGVATVYTITAAPAQGVLTAVATNTTTAYRYWRYIGANYTYSDIAEFQLFGSGTTTTPTPTPTGTPLSGKAYDTAGGYPITHGVASPFDGSLSTYFESMLASGGDVAIDLGSAKVVSRISFAPRSGYASRMVGGYFQASNSSTFASGVATVYTISTAPTDGSLTTVSTGPSTAYRYWRYVGPTGGYTDIAEFQLFA